MPTDAELRDVFKAFDTDGNGTLDLGEVTAALEKGGKDVTGNRQAYQILGELDADGDGKITFEEFKKAFELAPDKLPAGLKELVDATGAVYGAMWAAGKLVVDTPRAAVAAVASVVTGAHVPIVDTVKVGGMELKIVDGTWITPEGMTEVPANAFDNNKSLKSVIIGPSVTGIGKMAFLGCSGLKEVTIGPAVTTIGWSAFCACSGLKEVTIPPSVTTIGPTAFWRCSGLKELTIPPSVTTIYGGAFPIGITVIRQ